MHVISGWPYLTGKQEIASAYYRSKSQVIRDLHSGVISGALFLREGPHSGRWAAPVAGVSSLMPGQNVVREGAYQLPRDTWKVAVTGGRLHFIVVDGATSDGITIEVFAA